MDTVVTGKGQGWELSHSHVMKRPWVWIEQDGGDAAAGCLDKVGGCTAEEDLIV